MQQQQKFSQNTEISPILLGYDLLLEFYEVFFNIRN